MMEFVRKSGRARATADRWANAITEPSALDFVMIARVCDVSLEWLAEGDADIKPEAIPERNASDLDIPASITQIPILDARASAGAGIENFSDDWRVAGYFPFSTDELSKFGVKPENARALRIHGTSMVPTIPDDRIGLMDISKRELLDSLVYVFRAPDGLRVKRVRRTIDGRVMLVSDNKDQYDPEEFTTEEAERVITIGQIFWADRRV